MLHFSQQHSNYNASTTSDILHIAKADATVTVNGYTGTYDATAHGATGAATGVGGVAIAGLNLGATFTDAPGGTASWTFTGGTNYNDQSGSTAIKINKAKATVVVTPYNVPYDGQAHSATAAITGVNNENGPVVGTVTLNTTHTYSGTYATDTWSFTGAANYSGLSSASSSTTITDTITPVIISVRPSSATLWPPNHQMVAVSLSVGTNGDSGVTGYQVTATSSEPDNGLGDGDTPNDIQITGSGTLDPVINLRAERSGTGNGRTYTITARASDAAGVLSAPKSTTVFVPKSQGK